MAAGTRNLSREEWKVRLREWLGDEAKAEEYTALFDHQDIRNVQTLVKVCEDEPQELKDIGISVGHRVVIYANAKDELENTGRFRDRDRCGNFGIRWGGMGREFLSRELWRSGFHEGLASGIYCFIVVGIIIASGELPYLQTTNSGASYSQVGPSFTSASLGIRYLNLMRYLSIAIGTGFAFGLTSYIFGASSGGHITPAISWAYMLTSFITPLRFLVYVVNQLIGAMIGVGFIKAVSIFYFGRAEGGRNLDQPGYGDGNSFGIEILTTFILIMVTLSLTEANRPREDRWFGHLVLGFVFLVVSLISLPINGTSMNPTRSFASAALFHNWEGQWPLWIGPALGALAAAILYEWLIRDKSRQYGYLASVPGARAARTSVPVHRRTRTNENTPLNS